MARHQLSARAQMNAETVMSCIEDVSWLCHRCNPSVEEAETEANLMKGVVEDAFRHLLAEDQLSVETFTEECRKLGEAQCARLAVYHCRPVIVHANGNGAMGGRFLNTNPRSYSKEGLSGSVTLLCQSWRSSRVPNVICHRSHRHTRNKVRSSLRPPATAPAGVTSAPVREMTRSN